MFPPGTTFSDAAETAVLLRRTLYGYDPAICPAHWRPRSAAPFRCRVFRSPKRHGISYGARLPDAPFRARRGALYLIRVMPKADWVQA